jgi:hypothetical protein
VNWAQFNFVHRTIASVLRWVESVVDRMTYITLRVRWCHIILDVHAPTEDKVDDMEDSF